jgi:hypothetical protein
VESAAVFYIDAVQVNPGAAANTYLEAPTKGQLVPGKPVHIYATYSATDYAQFYGFIERLTPDPRGRSVAITCYDVLRRLSETEIAVGANTVVARSTRDYRVEVLSDFERGTINFCHNGSFETDTSGWTNPSQFSRVAGDAAPGMGSACGEFVAASQYNRVDFPLRLAPTYFAGSTYRFSCWVKHVSGPAFTLGAYIGSWSGSGFVTKTIPTTMTTWTRVTFTCVLPSTATASLDPLTFFIYANGAGTIRVDGLMVHRGQDDPVYTETATGRWPDFCGNGSFEQGSNGWYDGFKNLCGNPSFESDTTGWVRTGDSFLGAFCSSVTRYASDPVYGSARADFVTISNEDVAVYTGIYYAITGTFKAGQTVSYRAWFKDPSTATAVMVGIGSNGTPSDTAYTGGTLTIGAWTQYTGTWTPSADRTDVHLYLGCLSRVHTVQVDGIAVYRRDMSATVDPSGYMDTGPGGGGSPPTSDAHSTAQAKWGASSDAVVAPATANTGMVYDFNHFGSYFLSGRAYTASVWLYCTGSLPYKVGMGRVKGDGTWDEASTTGTASAATWTQVTVTWTPTADGSSVLPFDVVLFVYQTDATARTFYIDGVRVIPGASADAYEMSQWDLAKGRESSTQSPTTAIASTALSALTSLNEAVLTRHFIVPTTAAPWYRYTTKEWPGFAAKTSAETYNDDVADMAAADIDRAAIVNIAAIPYWSGATEYYTDQTSIGTYGLRPGTLGAAFMGGTSAAAKDVADVVGPAYVARYKDPRARPTITVVNRFPSQLQRELDDLVTVNLARLRIAGGKYLIVSLTTVVRPGGYWQTTYTVEEST